MSLRFAQSATNLHGDRKSTRVNSSHTEIYTLSLHDALPISVVKGRCAMARNAFNHPVRCRTDVSTVRAICDQPSRRSEEHTRELQSHRDLHSFPTRRSSDLSS